jgi:hypothetical protein
MLGSSRMKSAWVIAGGIIEIEVRVIMLYLSTTSAMWAWQWKGMIFRTNRDNIIHPFSLIYLQIFFFCWTCVTDSFYGRQYQRRRNQAGQTNWEGLTIGNQISLKTEISLNSLFRSRFVASYSESICCFLVCLHWLVGFPIESGVHTSI